MIIRVGCDLVSIRRFTETLAREPAIEAKLFSVAERRSTSPASLAGKYAAKEAVVKALDLKLTDIGQLEIKKTATGRPRLKLPNKLKAMAKSLQTCDISISHEGDWAMAVAVCIVKND